MWSMPNIVYKGNYIKEVQNESDQYDNISLYKDIEYFEEERPLVTFIKSCEKLVRNSKEYKVFEKWVTNTLGINFCQVNPDITSEDATIEMHHGPLFTLYDYVSIVLSEYLKQNKKIDSYRIADTIIQEHFDLRVQVVMLTITNHEGVHNKDIFLNVRQGIGDVSAFIEKYSKYLNDDYKYRIYRYIQLCKESPSFDNGILDIEKVSKLIEF